MRAPRGFALLAVLWVTTALVAIAAAAAAGTRTSASVTANRIALARGRWAAEGCQAVAQAKLDSVAREGGKLEAVGADTIWFADGAGCAASAVDPDARFNPRLATAEMRTRFDSALAEVGLVSEPDSLLTLDGDGRINVNAAPGLVLGSLPGFTPDVVRMVLEERAFGDRLTDLLPLAERLSPVARDALLAAYADVRSRVSWEAASLVVTASGWVDGQRPVATVQEVVALAGPRIAVVRRRVW